MQSCASPDDIRIQSYDMDMGRDVQVLSVCNISLPVQHYLPIFQIATTSAKAQRLEDEREGELLASWRLVIGFRGARGLILGDLWA